MWRHEPSGNIWQAALAAAAALALDRPKFSRRSIRSLQVIVTRGADAIVRGNIIALKVIG